MRFAVQQPVKNQEINLVSPPSSDKPVAHKRRAANAKLFDESEGEDDNSDLDQPIAKRLQTLPAASEQVIQLDRCPCCRFWLVSNAMLIAYMYDSTHRSLKHI